MKLHCHGRPRAKGWGNSGLANWQSFSTSAFAPPRPWRRRAAQHRRPAATTLPDRLWLRRGTRPGVLHPVRLRRRGRGRRGAVGAHWALVFHRVGDARALGALRALRRRPCRPNGVAAGPGRVRPRGRRVRHEVGGMHPPGAIGGAAPTPRLGRRARRRGNDAARRLGAVAATVEAQPVQHRAHLLLDFLLLIRSQLLLKRPAFAVNLMQARRLAARNVRILLEVLVHLGEVLDHHSAVVLPGQGPRYCALSC
jgi:hypothetical protein